MEGLLSGMEGLLSGMKGLLSGMMGLLSGMKGLLSGMMGFPSGMTALSHNGPHVFTCHVVSLPRSQNTCLQVLQGLCRTHACVCFRPIAYMWPPFLNQCVEFSLPA
ncbi:hypothetical protein DUNSADRAFT_9303 [Dunaliella salina]|uniref:Uncharacterized protein n=1 Tax=Dunaliella salina TaxID=3046 RepID=A0ABQ7GHS0_DUNSA|nr:hypothetical protein DUNSADRAFT_9303 [Dunaliella salina]|eukprot:KAF5834142.1 hypothetical protein DUNSADRAFT_9303 [Dunaliella salina]